MSGDTFDPRPDDYRDLIELARSLTVADTHLDVLPDDLWPGIEALLAAGPPVTVLDAPPMPSAPAPTSATDPSVAPVVALAGRRRPSRLPYLFGVAAAMVAAIVGLVAFVDRDDTSGTALDAVALSNQGLAPEGSASRARATLVEEADGRFALDVDVSGLPATDGFLELWIIDTDVKGMYSLGPLHGSGRYELPEHVDPAKFPIVDVSIEPVDGVPQHSGKSILRGQLTI
jgi:hypothetical protein